MRLSAHKDDPGFKNFERNRNVTVFLDGRRLYHCFTADDEADSAEVYATDENDKLIIEGDRLKTEMLTGRVEFVWEVAA